jgi:hypothetical protein
VEELLTGGNVAAVDTARDPDGGVLLAARPCSNGEKGLGRCSQWTPTQLNHGLLAMASVAVTWQCEWRGKHSRPE